MEETEKTGLRDRIERAFAPRTYPGDDHIGHIMPGCPGYEGNLAAEFFRGKDWRDIAFQDLLGGYDGPGGALVAFMEPQGIAYYLPAFLIMALDLTPGEPSDEEVALDGFVDSLCFYLARPSENSLREQYEMVKDMPEVPDEIKAQLRDPTPEAKAAERRIVDTHLKLIDLLSDAERAAVAATLAHLAGVFGQGAPDDSNNAQRALDTAWGRFGG